MRVNEFVRAFGGRFGVLIFKMSTTTINPFESAKIGDKKPFIRSELIDRRENFDFYFPQSPTAGEKIECPNSPALNPAIYSNVLLHSGEFVWYMVI